MMGRVTQGMMNTQLMRNLNNNLTRMNDLQNQMATGRKINKPSDDPVGLSFAMRYRSELSANEQYEENVGSALSWLEYTDSIMDQAGNVLHRARELAVQGSNGTNPQLAMDSIKQEIEELHKQLLSIGNSEFNGKHVFNGQMTDVAPYSIDTADTDITDSGEIQFEIGVGVKLPVNVNGNEVFGNSGVNDNAFKVLDDIAAALGSGDHNGVSMALKRLDTRFDSFLETRASIGAKMNRIQLADERLKDISLNLQTLQTKTEDADMAELITNLKTDENVYQASLSVGSKLIRQSLADFLR